MANMLPIRKPNSGENVHIYLFTSWWVKKLSKVFVIILPAKVNTLSTRDIKSKAEDIKKSNWDVNSITRDFNLSTHDIERSAWIIISQELEILS